MKKWERWFFFFLFDTIAILLVFSFVDLKMVNRIISAIGFGLLFSFYAEFVHPNRIRTKE